MILTWSMFQIKVAIALNEQQLYRMCRNRSRKDFDILDSASNRPWKWNERSNTVIIVTPLTLSLSCKSDYSCCSQQRNCFGCIISNQSVLISVAKICVMGQLKKESLITPCTNAVLYLAPHTPGGLQVVLVDLVDSRWSPPGFHKISHITTEFSGVHLESTWSSLESKWTPTGVHIKLTKILFKCYDVTCTL